MCCIYCKSGRLNDRIKVMSFYSGSLLFTSIASLALGYFVYLKGKNRSTNQTLAFFSLALSIWCLGQFMGGAVEQKNLVLFWTRLGLAGAIFIPVFFLHFVIVLLGREDRKILLATYSTSLILFILDFTPLFVRDVGPVLNFRYYPLAGPVYQFFAMFVLVCFGYGFTRLWQAFRHTASTTRNKLLYVVLASLVGFLGGVTAFFPIFGLDFPVLSHFALPIYLLITIYAILKHRLLDITVIVRQGLVYSSLTVVFAGFYVLVVLFANYFVSQYVRFNQVITVLLVVFASVLIFQPLKDRIQRLVDRLFSMGEYRYQKTINDLSVENQQLFSSLLRADKLASLGTMSAGMAHEIKNPLASIKGMTQVLNENLNDKDFLKKYQDVLGRQIDRINNIVEQLLKFGRPQQMTMSDIDLNDLIDDVINLFEAQSRKNNIEIIRKKLKLPRIKVDAEQITQVLTNLVLNAIEAMPKGGQLRLSTEAKDSGVEISVTDTGVGIGREQLDDIFDPFYSSKDQGTGMGLAVAYRSIKGHNGEIHVASQKGKGTKFTLWLPIKQKQ